MIGFLLALVLVVGGSSWEVAGTTAPGVVAEVFERSAHQGLEQAMRQPVRIDRWSCAVWIRTGFVPRWRDLRCGGLPAPRAPDLAPARRR